MPTDQTSSPLTRRNPLRSISFARPAAEVLGLTAQQTAEWNLTIARRDVPLLEQRYAVYCAALGSTNMLRGPMRRHWQAKALQQTMLSRSGTALGKGSRPSHVVEPGKKPYREVGPRSSTV